MKQLHLESIMFGICIVASQSSYAEVYFTQEQVQKALYPKATHFSITPKNYFTKPDSTPNIEAIHAANHVL